MILRGQPVAEKIYQKLKQDLKILQRQKITPTLAVVLVGNDPMSLVYVKVKEKMSRRLGINFQLFHLPGVTAEEKVTSLIGELNQNQYIHGIIIQLPLPEHFQTEKILKRIDSQKDVDGFYGELPAPTAQAILEILKFYRIALKDKKIVILGYGRLVGKPLEKMLIQQKIRPIICNSKTKNLKEKTLAADILITATGVPSLIRSEMVTAEAIIIDAGTSEVNGKMGGDISPAVQEKIRAYSPVPGGVGPVTVACLMRNVVEAAKKQLR